MRSSRLVTIAVSGLLLLPAGCGQADSDAAPDRRTLYGYETELSTREDLSAEIRLRFIFAELRHGKYEAVGDWNRAISSCAFFGSGPALNQSDAASGSPHGMKIYQLWAKDANAYLLAAKEAQPIGQIIVKESFTAREASSEEVTTSFYAERDGKKYKPDEPADLFIMFKGDPATPGTDEGWVYGILTADGKQLISSGSIKTCVDCHRQARHDRVFGEKPKTE